MASHELTPHRRGAHETRAAPPWRRMNSRPDCVSSSAGSGRGIVFGHGVRKTCSSGADFSERVRNVRSVRTGNRPVSVFTASSNLAHSSAGPGRPLPGRFVRRLGTLSPWNRPPQQARGVRVLPGDLLVSTRPRRARAIALRSWRRAGRACALASPLPSLRRPGGRPSSRARVGDRGRPKAHRAT